MRGIKDYYYPETIKMVTESVLGLFSNIIVFKFDRFKNKTRRINVPVQFGRSIKRQRFENDKEARKYYTSLPRINVRFKGLQIAVNRLTSPLSKRYWNENDIHFKEVDEKNEVIREINGLFSDYNPIPYDFQFEIEIPTTSLSDTSQILENILPYYTPKNTSVLRVREFSFLNIERDLPSELSSVSIDMGDDFSQDDIELILTNFSLGVSGYMYRPISGSKLVKTVLAKYFVNNELDKYVKFNEDGLEILEG